MEITQHKHKWRCFTNTKLICDSCKTVSEIDVLIENTTAAAAKQSKIDILSSQLFAGELKKDARDKYYAWCIRHNADALKKPSVQQETLL